MYIWTVRLLLMLREEKLDQFKMNKKWEVERCGGQSNYKANVNPHSFLLSKAICVLINVYLTFNTLWHSLFIHPFTLTKERIKMCLFLIIFNYFYLISCLWITLKSLIMLCLVQIVIIYQMTSCFQPKCFELVNRITGNKHADMLCLCTNVTCLLITATKKTASIILI